MKKILSVTFSGILSLFVALILLASVLCDFAYKTVCNQQVLVAVAEESGYTSELYEEIKYKWENLLSITGIMDTDPVMQVLTQEAVSDAAISYLADSYAGTADIDTQQIRDALEAKVRDYANSNNIHATPQEELEENINDLVSACMKEYTNSIKIPLLPRLLGATGKIGFYLTKVPVVCAICGALLLIFIFFLQAKRGDTLYFAAISTATNSLLILGGIGMIEHYHIADRLPVDVSALRTLAVSYFNTLIEALRGYGQLLLVVTALLLLLYVLILVLSALLKAKKVKVLPVQPKFSNEQ